MDERHTVWCLEMREVRARKIAQLALIGVCAFLENNKGVRRLAPALMRESDDCHLLHGGVPREQLRPELYRESSEARPRAMRGR